MFSHELKSVVFKGMLRPRVGAGTVPAATAVIPAAASPEGEMELCRKPERPMLYSVVAQGRADLRDPENSPSVSMWPYLLASAQTQRLNEISIYTEKGTAAEALRYLYMNDLALTIWAEMKKEAKVVGRLHRPPQGAVLAFGMPFGE